MLWIAVVQRINSFGFNMMNGKNALQMQANCRNS